ncbi:hypothetical protein Tco_1418666 [Tanacetum coccineum]
MSTSNQQTLADSGVNARPTMLEKGNYISWESRFRRFLDNKLEEGDRMWRSIKKRPYKRPMIANPDNTTEQILEPLSKMTEGNKKKYIADVKVMNYLLQAIPNDIYNSLDAYKNAKDMWERIKRFMFGSDVTSHVRHSRLMDEFDKFSAKEGESLKYVYERLTTLENIMDRNNVRPIQLSINTKFLNCLQPVEQICYHASKARKAAKNHDPLALLAHSNASSSQSHANSSYSPQPYYVTHPLSIVDYEEEYQGELQGDSQEDKLTTAMILLARAITQRFSTSTNNRLRTSSNTKNQAVIQDGRVDIQTKNAGYGGNGHYARDCQKLRVRDSKYFREQMLLAMKDEAGSNLKDEENDLMLNNSYRDDIMEELTTVIIMMARIQPADDNADSESSYDTKVVSEVNASNKVHEQVNHVKRKTIIHTSDDDQIDSNIILDDPHVENNGGTSEHDLNAHDEYHNIQMLAYNVQTEAENQKRLNNELKKQKELLQKELETFKDPVKTFESKTIQCSKYKETCEELECEIRGDKDIIERILKEKDKIESDFFKVENEKLIIQHQAQLAKKDFKE